MLVKTSANLRDSVAPTPSKADFAKFFGPLVVKNDPIFLKIKSVLALTPRNNNPKFQVDWLRNFDFIEQKPHLRPILSP